MIYVKDWEMLQESVDRLKALGIAEVTAKIDICNAVADRKIALRAIVSNRDHSYVGCALEGDQVGIPRRLSPADFDWSKSLPLQPWEGGRYPADIDWGERAFSVLELFTADILKVFPSTPPNLASYNSELPGRPTSAQLIMSEFLSRQSSGTTARTLAQEAKQLSEWLSRTHPLAPVAKPRTVENQIRAVYKQGQRPTK